MLLGNGKPSPDNFNLTAKLLLAILKEYIDELYSTCAPEVYNRLSRREAVEDLVAYLEEEL